MKTEYFKNKLAEYDDEDMAICTQCGGEFDLGYTLRIDAKNEIYFCSKKCYRFYSNGGK